MGLHFGLVGGPPGVVTRRSWAGDNLGSRCEKPGLDSLFSATPIDDADRGMQLLAARLGRSGRAAVEETFFTGSKAPTPTWSGCGAVVLANPGYILDGKVLSAPFFFAALSGLSDLSRKSVVDVAVT